MTEQPHKLSVGSLVETVNINSGNNSTGAGNSGFNGTFRVTGISSARDLQWNVTDLAFTVIDTITRTTDLPHFQEKEYIRQHITYKILKKFKSMFKEHRMVSIT